MDHEFWIDKINSIYYRQDPCHNIIPHLNDLSISELKILFYKKYGIESISDDRDYLKTYLRVSFPKALILAIDDNWVEMLIAALLTENNFPSKPPYEVYQVHCCYARTSSICTALGEALQYAKASISSIELPQRKLIIKILETRIALGELFFDCCDRKDGRTQVNINSTGSRYSVSQI